MINNPANVEQMICRAVPAGDDDDDDYPPTGNSSTIKVVNWNIWYQNYDLNGVAKMMVHDSKKAPYDIIGICESTKSSQLAGQITAQSGGKYKLQPGANGFQGYGTDIWYNKEKWTASSGGRVVVNRCGSVGGNRAVNWVVLHGKNGSPNIIAGGIHLSYFRGGNYNVQKCEVDQLINQFNTLKEQNPGYKAIWMGDMNMQSNDAVLNGARSQYNDVSQAPYSWHEGGSAIDIIFAEKGITRIGGGSTGDGIIGQKMVGGADHHP
eukprot:Pgem_evm1s7199